MLEPLLFVDLDGTLVKQDSFWLTVRHLARRAPLYTLLAFLQLPKGRAHVKSLLARRWVPGIAALEVNAEVRRFIEEEKHKGRTIVLATAADSAIAAHVCRELPLFTQWLASNGRINLSRYEKLKAIHSLCGGALFDYIGDSRADIPILRSARNGYWVSPASGAMLSFDESLVEKIR